MKYSRFPAPAIAPFLIEENTSSPCLSVSSCHRGLKHRFKRRLKHRYFPWLKLLHLVGDVFNVIGGGATAASYDVSKSLFCPFFEDVRGFMRLFVVFAKGIR